MVDESEFFEDLKRIKYLKKSFSRYRTTGEIRERLVLNHFIILVNVFGAVSLPRILFLRMREYLEYVKPFLILLNAWPDYIRGVGKERDFDTDQVALDSGIVEKLRKI